MKTIYQNTIILIFTVTLASGCGTFTKMRYSSGFKSNIEVNFGKNEETNILNKAHKATKYQHANLLITKLNPRADTVLVSDETTSLTETFILLPDKQQIASGEKHIIACNNKESQKSKIANATPLWFGKPLEPVTKWSAFILISGLLSLGLTWITWSPVLLATGLILVFISFVMAIIGQKRIESSNDYSGFNLSGIVALFGLLEIIVGTIYLILNSGAGFYMH